MFVVILLPARLWNVYVKRNNRSINVLFPRLFQTKCSRLVLIFTAEGTKHIILWCNYNCNRKLKTRDNRPNQVGNQNFVQK